MRYLSRLVVATLAFALGLISFLFCSALFALPRLSVSDSDQISPVNIDGGVSLRFSGCSGTAAVFTLENKTEHPIYARVERAYFGLSFQEANLERGMSRIEHRAFDAPDFKNISPMFNETIPFRMIPPYTSVRYGIFLWPYGEGEIRVKMPYMEDAELARRLDEKFVPLTKDEFERVRGAWREAASVIIVNNCQ